MSDNIRRHLLKYRDDGEALSGDDSSGTGGSWPGLIASLANMGIGIASQKQKESDDKKKTQADKESAAKANDTAEAADLAAQKARAQATYLKNAATLAAGRAAGETTTFGPLHVAAQKAADQATMADQKATSLEQKAAQLKSLTPAGQQQIAAMQAQAALAMQPKPSVFSKVPTWAWFGIGGLAIGGVGVLGWKLLHSSKKA